MSDKDQRKMNKDEATAIRKLQMALGAHKTNQPVDVLVSTEGVKAALGVESDEEMIAILDNSDMKYVYQEAAAEVAFVHKELFSLSTYGRCDNGSIVQIASGVNTTVLGI